MDKNKEQEVNFEEIDKLVNDTYAEEEVQEPAEVEIPDEVEEVKEVEPKKTGVKRDSKKEKTPTEATQELDNSCECDCGQSEPKKAWIDMFTENYLGKSKVSKDIEPFLKENYKGNPYLPWATMERITYQLDPKARFTNICNRDGGLVHSDIIILEQSSKTNEKEVVSSAPMMSHMVKVTLEFMGRVFIEDYPIQDTDYSPAKIFNQNLVNRALQRAKARVAARATGVGLRLYEGQDLQFDHKLETTTQLTNPKPTKEEIIKVAEAQKVTTTVKVTPVKPAKVTPAKPATVASAEEQKVQNIADGGDTKAFVECERTLEPQGTIVEASAVIEASADVMKVVNLIKKGDETKVNSVLQRVNVSLIKKYHFGLSRTDSEADLIAKITKFPDAAKFKQSLINLGIE